MSQVKILEAIINKVIAEELSDTISEKDGESTFVTPDGTKGTLTRDQRIRLSKMRPGSSVSFQKAGTVLETDQSNVELPKATDIAGKIAEMVDSLKAISEGSGDVKIQKMADKASAQLEAAKSTLEALTAHEVMLQEKEHDQFLKQANKKRKVIERYLSRKIKMPEVVQKIMKKLPEEKVAEMLKRAKGELDEEKVAGAMMKVALREGYIPNNL
jgi:hypothetical protein